MLLAKTKDAETKAIIEAKLKGTASNSQPSQSKPLDGLDDLEFTSSSPAGATADSPKEEKDEYDSLFSDL
jgi:hypothetical protein